MALQLATVDVPLNAFYGPNAQPYHQIPPKLKTKVITGFVNPRRQGVEYFQNGVRNEF